MVNIGTTIARPFAAQVQLHSRAEHMLHFHDQPGYSVHPSVPGSPWHIPAAFASMNSEHMCGDIS